MSVCDWAWPGPAATCGLGLAAYDAFGSWVFGSFLDKMIEHFGIMRHFTIVSGIYTV